MISYFTTHLSFTLLVKEFLRLVNIWRSYGQNLWLCHIPHPPCTFVLKGSIAKNLRCDELLYYTFIIHSDGERIFKIGEHLAKLRAKSLTVSYTPFALHFCPQRCRSRQISWITCVLQTETAIKRCYVNRQINVS